MSEASSWQKRWAAGGDDCDDVALFEERRKISEQGQLMGGGGGNRGLKFLSVLFVPSFLDLPLLQQRPNVTN